jgi:hypothetical protein
MATLAPRAQVVDLIVATHDDRDDVIDLRCPPSAVNTAMVV